MKNLLYIGNYLNTNSSNVSSIHLLGGLLEHEAYTVTYASNVQNKVLRLCHMVYATLVNSRDVDVVIIDTYSTLNFYYALVISQLCRLLGLKYVTNLNGGNLPNRLKNNPKLSRLIFKNAHTNVAPSLYLKTIFNDYGYTNVVHIPNTIEIENYLYQKRNYETPRLLWVRSFSKIYNPKLAVEILKALEEDGLNASLIMIGPDADSSMENVMTLAKELGVNVEFTGKLTKKEWIKRSRDTNIFINTTNFDNMPVSVIEAMALGLPVISTNVGGMPYLIEDKVDGILVNPNSVSEFVMAIKKLLKDTATTDQMVKNARLKVENFDWQVVKNKWFKVLSD